jgi:hypothetical protein
MPDSDIHGLSEFHSLDGLKQWIGTARS